jgi:hypothetical protein
MTTQGTESIWSRLGCRPAQAARIFDQDQRERAQAIELIESLSARRPRAWAARKDIAMLQTAPFDAATALRIWLAGGRWNAELQVWELDFWSVVEHQLEPWML